ncbi:MAG: HEAT repeat domain-containing protein [Balneolales bacterium]|nr:HEAT repeat domain-containing protein [Balneolales bacterium]
MTEEKYVHLITGFFQDSLSAEEAKELQKLMDEGRINRSEIEELNKVYTDLEAADSVGSINSDRMKLRFEKILHEEKSETVPPNAISSKGAVIFRQYWLAAAASALILFLAGFSAGLMFGTGQGASAELTAVQQEVERIKNTLVFQAYQRSSASERIHAVGLSSSMPHADDQLILILIHTMNNDPNINVRLASIDALRSFGAKENVRAAFIQSLGMQQHPLVQISLIDVLVDLDDREAVAEMERLLATEDTLPEIRDRLIRGISELRM